MRTTKLVLKKLQKEKENRVKNLSDRLGVADQLIVNVSNLTS